MYICLFYQYVDSHGGVIIYVKDSIHYRRRNDVELQGIECIWVQLTDLQILFTILVLKILYTLLLIWAYLT